jgi:hypothetical protein
MTFLKSKDMNSIPTLTGSHLRTYNAIFQHPLSHNLGWHGVRALLKELGQIVEEPNGNLKATRNGQVLVLHRPHAKDVTDAHDVIVLRHFLEQSGTPPVETDEKDAHWLLVIDHRMARIFRSEVHGAAPRQILAHQSEQESNEGHDAQDFAKGSEREDANRFFKPVAEALQMAGKILVFGTGAGKSSEKDQFINWLKTHHPDLSKRIIGSLTVDEHHLTNDQLLAIARNYYKNQPVS